MHSALESAKLHIAAALPAGAADELVAGFAQRQPLPVHSVARFFIFGKLRDAALYQRMQGLFVVHIFQQAALADSRGLDTHPAFRCLLVGGHPAAVLHNALRALRLVVLLVGVAELARRNADHLLKTAVKAGHRCKPDGLGNA